MTHCVPPRPCSWMLRVPLALVAAAGLCPASLGQQTPPVQPAPAVPVPPVPTGEAPQPSPAPREGQSPAVVEDGPAFEVSSFILRYATTNPDQPPLEDFGPVRVRLSLKDGTYVAPREGLTTIDLTIGELEAAGRARRPYAVSAINAIAAAIVRAMNERGIVGVLVTPDPSQIDPRTLEDRRPAEVRTLNLDVWTRTVARVRSLGAGPRWSAPTAGRDAPSQETRIDNRRHARIRENSPLQPGDAAASGDVLRRDVLDRYLYRLNRHPARRVEAAISAGDTPGEVVLDYIVTENKPWTLYFQLSNTGTEETDRWRERIGFQHFQLTGRDDIFSLDYVTAGFKDTHAVLAYYDAPIGSSQVLRGRVYGSWSEFTASDVGFEGEDFSGDSWQFGGELSLNVWQRRAAFLDVFGGARFEHVHVDNEAVALEGEEEFFLPYFGVRFDRSVAWADTHADVRIETNLASVAGTGDEVQRLGRIDPDKRWTTLKWALSHSVYLDHLGEADASADAHELALSFRGQHALGNRLIPQEQEVIGGLYSVRGYPEALVAGDTVYIASAEYRYHLPRRWSPRDPSGTRVFGRPFRWAPDRPGGRPDWDLILKGFVDGGRAMNSDRLSFEENETLLGAGVGVEVQFMRNVNLRLDWGFALKDARDVEAGDNRLHFVGTLLW
jgi:hemolysin activation/secretion protein